jgi:hypothetical protein
LASSHCQRSVMIRFSLRIPADLHERVIATATADRRSLNSRILHPLEAALATARADAGPPGGDPAPPAPLRGNRIPPRPEGRGILRLPGEQARHSGSSLVRTSLPHPAHGRPQGYIGTAGSGRCEARGGSECRTLDGPVCHTVRICLFTISCDDLWALD